MSATPADLPAIPRVAVWNYREVRGFDANNPHVPTWPMVPIRDALTRSWPTDAHFVPYEIPGDNEIPRLRKAALPTLKKAGSEPLMRLLVVDLDNPNHTRWTDLASTAEEALDLQRKKVRTLRLMAPRALIYTTRAGARLIWLLSQPIPVSLFNSWAERWLSTCGIPDVDTTSAQWTRCFRLPSVVRDGKRSACIADFTPLDDPSTNKLPVDLSAASEDLPPVPVPRGVYTQPDGPNPAHNKLFRHVSLRSLAGRHLGRLTKGRVLAEPGDRNNTVFAVIRSIAHQLPMPHATDPRSLYSMVAQSAYATLEEDEHDRVWEMCVTTADKEAAYREASADLEETPQPVGSAEDPASLPDDPIVFFTEEGSYYLRHHGNDQIYGPYTATTAIAGLRIAQPDVPHTNDKGTLLDGKELAYRYGSPIRQIIYEMGRTSDKYDPFRHTLRLKCAIPEAVEPRRHPIIEEWLYLLGGKRADDLLDWLATVRLLSEATTALYIQDDGKGGAGKGLLSTALARMWGRPAVPFGQAISRFNSSLIRQPLVHLDEGYSAHNTGRVTAAFRSLVAESTHKVEGKHVNAGVLIGHPRVIITANNAGAIDFSEFLTHADVEAIAARITHISSSPHAKGFLEALGGRRALAHWVRTDDDAPGAIAQHVAYLEATRQVETGTRFLVEQQEQTHYHKTLAIRSDATTEVLAAVANAVSMRGPAVAAIMREGEIWVNASNLYKHWKIYTSDSDRDRPRKLQISKVLKGLNKEGRGGSRQFHIDGRNIRFWKAPRDLVLEVADTLGMASFHQLKVRILAAEQGEDRTPEILKISVDGPS